VGLLSALADPDTTVVSDLFNHASIIDGIRLAGAELRPFKHNSVAHLAQILKSRSRRRLLVVVEGVYSADGDRAPIQEIAATAHKFGALCIVDEAHSLGVLGPHGRGAVADADALADVDILTGTLSKSLASVGGFIATTSGMADLVRHRARPLIFSASLPAAQAAAASTALKISLEGLHLRTRLWSNKGLVAQRFRTAGLDTLASTTPIIPVLVGDKFRTFQAASELRRRGVLVCPAVPPMVQNHLSRLRLHVTAAHSSDDVLAATAEIIDVLG
jgi:7-keto-8-aminopelargonate synthetase-like enzyme